jgi:hypothetical protein
MPFLYCGICSESHYPTSKFSSLFQQCPTLVNTGFPSFLIYPKNTYPSLPWVLSLAVPPFWLVYPSSLTLLSLCTYIANPVSLPRLGSFSHQLSPFRLMCPVAQPVGIIPISLLRSICFPISLPFWVFPPFSSAHLGLFPPSACPSSWAYFTISLPHFGLLFLLDPS